MAQTQGHHLLRKQLAHIQDSIRLAIVFCLKAEGRVVQRGPITSHFDRIMHTVALPVIDIRKRLGGREVRCPDKYIRQECTGVRPPPACGSHHLSKTENDKTDIHAGTDKLLRFVVVESSPALSDKAGQLLKLLPDIDDQMGTSAETEIDHAGLQHA